MDAVYVFRHSRFNDIEIRYSLRSVARHMPWVRKVWIFGDQPAFLTEDTSVAEHVPQRYVARVGDFPTPVTNFFQMLFLASLIPELNPHLASLVGDVRRHPCVPSPSALCRWNVRLTG